MEYIAEFKAPKQRITRQFGYVIKHDQSKGERGYSVHRKFYDAPHSYEHGSYDLTYDGAAKLFAEKVTRHVTQYPPEVFDVDALAKQPDTIEISWHIDDVKHQDETLTDEQALEVLHLIKNNHDATIGVNWEVIDAAISIIKDA